ncbi:UNVERIFIED_CONTAM: Peptidyl-prolyl cis-trans isomerase CYP95 [Sesamum angustifolium]|uniref:Peptidyl-prolyl cis-trans isomerase CYP95 n=1 Tax=Sesamum angustifolium TaxID=2727405 RepID=A0AAW2ML40_9LAMI
MEKIKGKKQLVFLDVSIDGDPVERMIFECTAFFTKVDILVLYAFFSPQCSSSLMLPKTTENFRALCTGEKGVSAKTGKPLHYKGTFFHRIKRGYLAQATMEKVYMMGSFQVVADFDLILAALELQSK